MEQQLEVRQRTRIFQTVDVVHMESFIKDERD